MRLRQLLRKPRGPTRSPQGDAALEATLRQFQRAAHQPFPEELPLSRDDVEEARKYRIKTRREQSFNAFWQWVRLKIGYSYDRAEHSDKTNKLFETEIAERKRQDRAIDELTQLCNFLACRVRTLQRIVAHRSPQLTQRYMLDEEAFGQTAHPNREEDAPHLDLGGQRSNGANGSNGNGADAAARGQSRRRSRRPPKPGA